MSNLSTDVMRKNPEREEIERLTREFLAGGGEIKHLDQNARAEGVSLSKRAKERGNDETI